MIRGKVDQHPVGVAVAGLRHVPMELRHLMVLVAVRANPMPEVPLVELLKGPDPALLIQTQRRNLDTGLSSIHLGVTFLPGDLHLLVQVLPGNPVLLGCLRLGPALVNDTLDSRLKAAVLRPLGVVTHSGLLAGLAMFGLINPAH
jgi:hypothetical protein